MNKQKSDKPRGIRNNNPLNIRKGEKWIGIDPHKSDRSFAVFYAMVYGWRAAFVILYNYIYIYRIKNIEGVIHRWAPMFENDTDAYIRAVLDYSGIKSDETLNFYNKDQMIRLGWAMAMVENGPVAATQYLFKSDCERGYDMARMSKAKNQQEG